MNDIQTYYQKLPDTKLKPLPNDILITSQGVKDVMRWKGIPLYKSVYDFALISMILWKLQPKTIFEMGSGEGGSAVWMSDLCRTYGNKDCSIYSVDIKIPLTAQFFQWPIHKTKIFFLEGDTNEIEKVFPDLSIYPHPWLILEDAHQNITGIVKMFSEAMEKGDYLIIEDVRGSINQILDTLLPALNSTGMKRSHHYTDFFGPNATANSIWYKEHNEVYNNNHATRGDTG